MLSRRELAYGASSIAIAGGIAVTAVSCSTPNLDVVSTVAQLIQKIQAGVAAACTQFGKWIPTVETVISVVSSLLGGTLVAANLADALKLVQGAIDAIASQCPKPAPTPAPAPTATINGKPVPIAWY